MDSLKEKEFDFRNLYVLYGTAADKICIDMMVNTQN